MATFDTTVEVLMICSVKVVDSIFHILAGVGMDDIK